MRNKACSSVKDANCRGLRAAGDRAIHEMFSPLFSILDKRSLLVDT
jgi:hypothetical protein